MWRGAASAQFDDGSSFPVGGVHPDFDFSGGLGQAGSGPPFDFTTDRIFGDSRGQGGSGGLVDFTIDRIVDRRFRSGGQGDSASKADDGGTPDLFSDKLFRPAGKSGATETPVEPPSGTGGRPGYGVDTNWDGVPDFFIDGSTGASESSATGTAQPAAPAPNSDGTEEVPLSGPSGLPPGVTGAGMGIGFTGPESFGFGFDPVTREFSPTGPGSSPTFSPGANGIPVGPGAGQPTSPTSGSKPGLDQLVQTLHGAGFADVTIEQRDGQLIITLKSKPFWRAPPGK
jgi:hypothetical protein